MTEFEDSEKEVEHEVRRIIDELKNEVITVENYKKYVVKINHRNELIASFIQNNIARFSTLKNKLEKVESEESFKRAEKEGYVPKQAYEIQQDMNQIFKDTYSWKALSADMSEIFFSKISNVLEDIKALDIKKDALNEMRDMISAQNENNLSSIRTVVENSSMSMKNFMDMMEEIINHKLGMLDEKINKTVGFIEQESTLRTKYMVKHFIESINIPSKNKEIMLESNKQLDKDNFKNATELKKVVSTPIGKVNLKHIYQKLEDEQEVVKKTVVEDPFAKKDVIDDDIDDNIIIDDEGDM